MMHINCDLYADKGEIQDVNQGLVELKDKLDGIEDTAPINMAILYLEEIVEGEEF